MPQFSCLFQCQVVSTQQELNLVVHSKLRALTTKWTAIFVGSLLYERLTIDVTGKHVGNSDFKAVHEQAAAVFCNLLEHVRYETGMCDRTRTLYYLAQQFNSPQKRLQHLWTDEKLRTAINALQRLSEMPAGEPAQSCSGESTTNTVTDNATHSSGNSCEVEARSSTRERTSTGSSFTNANGCCIQLARREIAPTNQASVPQFRSISSKARNQCDNAILCIVCKRGSPFPPNSLARYTEVTYLVIWALMRIYPLQRYFHFHSDIFKFIKAHWDILYPGVPSESLNWKGAVLNALYSYKKLFAVRDRSKSGYWTIRLSVSPYEYGITTEGRKYRRRYVTPLPSTGIDSSPIGRDWQPSTAQFESVTTTSTTPTADQPSTSAYLVPPPMIDASTPKTAKCPLDPPGAPPRMRNYKRGREDISSTEPAIEPPAKKSKLSNAVAGIAEVNEATTIREKPVKATSIAYILNSPCSPARAFGGDCHAARPPQHTAVSRPVPDSDMLFTSPTRARFAAIKPCKKAHEIAIDDEDNGLGHRMRSAKLQRGGHAGETASAKDDEAGEDIAAVGNVVHRWHCAGEPATKLRAAKRLVF